MAQPFLTGVLPKTHRSETKFEIYTPKRDDKHPRPFRMGVPPPAPAPAPAPGYQISPNDINTKSSREKVKKINETITKKGKFLDLLSNSPNKVFKKCVKITLENFYVDIGSERFKLRI